MLEIKSNNGTVDIIKMDGTEKRIVSDIGVIAHKVLLLIANQGATTAEDVYIKYGALSRQLVDYIETTVKRVDEIGRE